MKAYTIEWQVTADRAIMDENQVVTFYDNVVAKNLLPGKLRYNDHWKNGDWAEKPSAHSDTPVHMIGTFLKMRVKQ